MSGTLLRFPAALAANEVTMLRTLSSLLLGPAAIALVLGVSALARAGDPDVEARHAALDAVLLDTGSPAQRAKKVHELADLASAEAARALVDSLEKLAERKTKLEERHHRTKAEYQPYEGFTFTDPKAWDIKKRLRGELDQQAAELQADSVVLLAFGTAISKFVDQEANKTFIRQAGLSPWMHSRRVLYAGLLRNAVVDPADVGKRALKDKDPIVRLTALDALADRKDPATLDLAIKALKEDGWPHRQAAARILQGLGDAQGIAPLVNAMATDEGRMLEVYAEALQVLSGAEIGPFPDAWKSWYDENKERLAEMGAKPQSTKRAKAGADAGIDYYGIETKSRRMVFLIDISGSMKEPIGDAPQDVTGQVEDTYSGLKVDIAKKVLKQAIRNLPDNAFFNIVVFNHAVKVFEPGLIEATQDNKNKAYLMINDLEASGSTYTYGALEKAFAMAGRGITDKAYDPGVDTIFVLSDGAPTDSSIDKAEPMEPKIVLDAVTEWNQFAKIVIHTIAIDPRIGAGGKGFVRFMKSLAAQNAGTYTEIGGDGHRSGGGKD